MDFSFLISISDGDTGFINEFISTFESTTLVQIRKMKDDFLKKDIDSVKRLAHQIKPTAEMLGFNTFPDIVSINNNPTSVNINQLERIIKEAELILKQLKKEFQSKFQ